MTEPQVPTLEAVERDVLELVERRFEPGASSYLSAVPHLVHVRAAIQARRHTMAVPAAAEAGIRTALFDAIAELGESDDGKVAQALLLDHGTLGDRQQAAAEAIGVHPRTIRRSRQADALRTLAGRLFRREIAFLSDGALPAALLRDDRLLCTIWSSGGDSDVILAGGAIPATGSQGPYNVQAGDVYALMEAHTAIRQLCPRVTPTVLPASRVVGAKLGDNLISIGGPRWNTVTRDLLKRLAPPWQFSTTTELGTDRSALRDASSARTLATTLDRSGEVERTYGTIVSAPNPRNATTRVTIFAGLTTFGVLAATRLLSPELLTRTGDDPLRTICSAYADCTDRAVLQVLVAATVVDGEVLIANHSVATRPLPVVR